VANWPIQQIGATGENVRSVQYLLNAHGVNNHTGAPFYYVTSATI
jgi:hypothetical protein